IHRPRYFTKLHYEAEFPAIWFTNPFLNPPVQCIADKHWSDYPMYDKQYEDLKFIWEYGRFSNVFDMVRSYFLTGDDSLPEQYWTLIESWIDHNPPNTGPHWKCGQETSLRLMAWYFGLFAFKNHPATTPERFTKFLAAVAVQADRVSKDLNYSYLQHSNHAVSEGLGLYATALLFPQLQLAEEWKKRGKAILENRVLFLVRPDGTYYQKSHNYLRFILHAYLYVLALAEVHKDTFSDTLKQRLDAALSYLKSVLDERSGRVPNYGSNDGALVLPLNSCDLTDYRSVVAALHYYLHREKCFASGPWHEDLLWLFGTKALDPVQTPAVDLPVAKSMKYDRHGIYLLRTTDSWAFMHAESFRDRPAHADALHLDLWWKGLNICVDPGTYLYYGHQPWFDAFRHTRAHNTIEVDGKDQMERAYRFTWGKWHTCRLNQWLVDQKYPRMELEQHGYHRLSDPVTHRRAVICVEEQYWLVIDDLLGTAQHRATLHWLLNDFPFQHEGSSLHLDTPAGPFHLSVQLCEETATPLEIIQGDPKKNTFGLRSNYYGWLETGISVRLHHEGVLPIRLVSCFGPKGWNLDINRPTLWQLQTPQGHYQLELGPKGTSPIIQAIKP
ncbi:MAG: alginate lyase family protein, partial [Bacteroidota bacterium]